MHDDVREALAALDGALPRGALGVVLGSGLAGLPARLETRASIDYGEVAGFPACRVPGHAGRLHAGRLGTRDVVVFEGRVHLYEGASAVEVTFAVRLLAALEARAVVLTAAAGGIHPRHATGDLVLVRDHLNLTGEDPARHGALAHPAGSFPCLHPVYHPVLLDRLSALVFTLGIPYTRGVLAGVRGPSYETEAEAAALRALGADVVAMSTVVEAMAAAQIGLPVAALAVVTNRSGEADTRHDDVLRVAAARGEAVADILATAIEVMDWAVPRATPAVR